MTGGPVLLSPVRCSFFLPVYVISAVFFSSVHPDTSSRTLRFASASCWLFAFVDIQLRLGCYSSQPVKGVTSERTHVQTGYPDFCTCLWLALGGLKMLSVITLAERHMASTRQNLVLCQLRITRATQCWLEVDLS